jgi:putative transposase
MGRAKGRSPLFVGDPDRVLFLIGLRDVVTDLGWGCLSYCLMTTHYHLLVTTPQPNLARGMQRLNGRYGAGFNLRHRGRGHVFGDRYRCEPITRDSHLLETLRYIALNPVRAGLVRRPEDWRWSSHAALIDSSAPLTWLAANDVLELFGGGPQARRRYSVFVAEGLA